MWVSKLGLLTISMSYSDFYSNPFLLAIVQNKQASTHAIQYAIDNEHTTMPPVAWNHHTPSIKHYTQYRKGIACHYFIHICAPISNWHLTLLRTSLTKPHHFDHKCLPHMGKNIATPPHTSISLQFATLYRGVLTRLGLSSGLHDAGLSNRRE